MKKSIFSILAVAALAGCVKNDPPVTPPTGDSTVTINEAYSRGKGSVDPELDWVELYNNSDEAVDISGWILSDKVDKSEKITLPAGTSIAAKAFMVITVDTPEGFGLSSDGDMVYLYDNEGEAVHFVEFGPMEETESWSANPDGSDTYKKQSPTKGRSNNGAVVNPSVTDAAHTPASPVAGEAVVVSATVAAGEGTISSVVLEWELDGTAQTGIDMTAGTAGTYSATIPAQAVDSEVEYTVVATNSAGGEATASGNYSVRAAGEVDYTGLVINEVDGNGKFVELYNASDATISLAGVQIIKNEETDAADVWWTGGSAEIAAGDYYTICEEGGDLASDVDEATGNGGISPKKNVQFELKEPDDTLIDIFTRSTTLDLDDDCTPDYGKTTPKYSFARCPDGTGTFGLAEPTADAANPFIAAGAIVTNEATSLLTNLVINEVDGNGKFIEIYNNGSEAVSLEGVVIVKNLEADEPWWTGGNVEITAGNYYTICEEGGALAAEVDEATGDGGISPKKTVRFDMIHAGMLLDVFARVDATGAIDEDCTPDYGKTTPKYSFSRCPDGTGAFGLAEPSVDAANPATSAGAIETTLAE